jgi:tripartite-type tricarboxylate transporter receptor subunit TctC
MSGFGAAEWSRRQLLRAGVVLGAGTGLGGCGVTTRDEETDGVTARFPERPVEWVVPFAAGGSTDLIARTLAQGLEDPLGQPVVVVNREGAGGAVGTKEVISGTPDGYRMAFPPSSLFAITPYLQQSATRIPIESLRIVTGLTVENLCLLVHEDSKYATVEDLLADRTATIRFAHSGVGTGSYLSQVLFFQQAGIAATHVPFGGTGPAVTALVDRQVDVAASHLGESRKQVAAGKLRRLVLFTEQRSPLLLEVPTAKEKGIDVVVDQMRFVAVPPQVSGKVTAVLVRAFADATQATAYDKFLAENFIDRRELPGPELTRKIKADRERYRAALARFGIRAV